MPYKVDGKKVLVLKNGEWKLLARHPSKAEAEAHKKKLTDRH